MRVLDSVLPALALMALLAILAGVALRARLRDATRAIAAAEKARRHAEAEEAASLRLLRLAAAELGRSTMTLLGHAQRLAAAPCSAGCPGCSAAGEHGVAISAQLMQVMRLADDLHDQTVDTGAQRVLRKEPIDLAAMLEGAIAWVSAALGPGRRNWKRDPALAGVTLTADRRAVHEVLTRVLANAVRCTADQDWIDIHLDRNEDEIILSIADEGAGRVLPGSPPTDPRRPDSRGLGLGLSLARFLMQAHGGTLAVESATDIGTRVILTFPASRSALEG